MVVPGFGVTVRFWSLIGEARSPDLCWAARPACGRRDGARSGRRRAGLHGRHPRLKLTKRRALPGVAGHQGRARAWARACVCSWHVLTFAPCIPCVRLQVRPVCGVAPVGFKLFQRTCAQRHTHEYGTSRPGHRRKGAAQRVVWLVCPLSRQ